VVLNYGFVKNWEAVGEFRVEASPELELTDPALSLKGVLKEGVLQVNGESTQGQRPNNSALLGVICHPTSKNVFLDAGVRRGISRAAPDWQFTIGLTFGFSLPTSSRQ
jgi:hypothetical protein